MDIRPGDRVSVNLAPFIGSKCRSRQSVPCEVLAVDEDFGLQVAAEHPCRRCVLCVDPDWVDERLPDRAEPVPA